MVESKFNFWSFVAVISSLLLFVLLFYILCKIGIMNLPVYASIPLLALLLFLMVWLLFGEIRTKLIKIKIENNSITVKNFIGLGIEKKYYFREFDGYKISILPSEYQDFEYLYLFAEQRKVIKISQFYHSNYAELKQSIIRKTKNLGTAHFNFVAEVKEIFIV